MRISSKLLSSIALPPQALTPYGIAARGLAESEDRFCQWCNVPEEPRFAEERDSTFNRQHRTLNSWSALGPVGCCMFDVECWAFPIVGGISAVVQRWSWERGASAGRW